MQLLDDEVVLEAVKPGSRIRQESVNLHTRVVWLQVLSASYRPTKKSSDISAD